MKQIFITTYLEFENFCKLNFKNEEFSTMTHSVYISATFSEIEKILSLCYRAISADKSHANFIYGLNLEFKIRINKVKDFDKINNIFLSINNEIIKKITVVFYINITTKTDVNLLHLLQNHYSYLFNKHSLKYTTKVTFNINENDELVWFNNTISTFETLDNNDINDFILNYADDRYRLNTLCKHKIFIFNVNLELQDDFDFAVLHNYLLVCSKYEDFCDGFIINIKGSNIYKIKLFVSTIITEKIYVISNNILLTKELNNVGKLIPALYIANYDDLLFLQNPLDKRIWKKIVPSLEEKNGVKAFRIESINAKTDFGCNINTNKFWPYLRLCQKYLFEDFDNNVSKSYTQLRRIAFCSTFFYNEYVSKIPFLALFVFAIYDNFYRNNMLLQFKNDCNKGNYRLGLEDFLLSKQTRQNYSVYETYKKVNNKYDIKNLLLHYDEDNLDNIKLHTTVTAEIFECISISEGLLQILENALLHANGGLFSMRIYSRAKGLETQKSKKENHVEYLNAIYSENYFEYKNADFYLEVKISDLSEQSIVNSFFHNNINNNTKLIELLKKHEWNDSMLENVKQNIDLQYFFSHKTNSNNSLISEKIYEFKKMFYEIDENLVHHYGLETFNSILTSRDGIFSVCGHNNSYDNLTYIFDKIYSETKNNLNNSLYEFDTISKTYTSILLTHLNNSKSKAINRVRHIISSNIDIPGTTFRILFPLNHSSINEHKTNKILVDSGLEMTPDYQLVTINHSIEFETIDNIKTKQKNINDFFSYIKSVFSLQEKKSDVKMLCIDMYPINHELEYGDKHFEEIIKGVLLFGLRELKDNPSCKVLPIAIVNLTPFQLIEASRIISIYYTKDTEPKDDTVFRNMPIYLKCTNSSKEVLFAGENITDVKNTLIKTVMKNGTMYDDLNTIIRILEKSF